jgi:hypothetical protein
MSKKFTLPLAIALIAGSVSFAVAQGGSEGGSTTGKPGAPAGTTAATPGSAATPAAGSNTAGAAPMTQGTTGSGMKDPAKDGTQKPETGAVNPSKPSKEN